MNDFQNQSKPKDASCPACKTKYSADEIDSLWAQYRTSCMDSLYALSSRSGDAPVATADDQKITVKDIGGRSEAFPLTPSMTVKQLMEAVQNSIKFQTPVKQQQLLFKRANIAVYALSFRFAY